MRELAAAGGFAVIGVDHPLSPEHKYPVALDRIEALMRWLFANGDAWGIDPARLAIGGDSAGANLSFATALRLRRTRSEEHTSELQSLMRISYAVFCLKKKTNR